MLKIEYFKIKSSWSDFKISNIQIFTTHQNKMASMRLCGMQNMPKSYKCNNGQMGPIGEGPITALFFPPFYSKNQRKRNANSKALKQETIPLKATALTAIHFPSRNLTPFLNPPFPH